MRPERQVKVISSQIEILDEFKIKLESVLEFANNVIQKGNSWIEETNSETYFEINKFLTDKTFECVSQCQDIGKDNGEESHGHSDLEEQNTKDTRTKTTDTLNTTKPEGLDLREKNEYKKLSKKCQELDKIISKNYRKLQKQFEEHKNETKETLFKESEEIKETLCRVRKEIENEHTIKWNEIWNEFQQASNFMSDLKTENEDVNKQIVSLQEQIKEQEQKSETFMEQQKSTQNSFSLRLDEVMKDLLGNTESINKLKSDSETLYNVVNEQTKKFDTSITNLNEKLKDLKEKIKVMDDNFKEIEDNNKTKFDDNILKSTELLDKIVNVSSQVDTMYKEFKLSRQQAGFYAQMKSVFFRFDLSYGQIVKRFDKVQTNTGNHYDPTTGIFTAPCDGLYLWSLTLRFENGENVKFFIRKENSRSEKNDISLLQTSIVKSWSSLNGLVNLNQNDKIYVVSCGHYEGLELNGCSSFMCAVINKD